MRSRCVASMALALACSSSGSTRLDPSMTSIDASSDAASDAMSAKPTDKAATCAATFGSELTNGFGRLDGTILAVVPPTNRTCAQPNSTHLVLQLNMHGAAYRAVINVSASGADPRVFFLEKSAPLSPWSEGWHAGAKLDYTTLGVTSAEFQPMETAALVSAVTDRLEIGARVSVFATSTGGTKADSAHLVHRNAPDMDGAVVVSPDANPRYLLFRFVEQSF